MAGVCDGVGARGVPPSQRIGLAMPTMTTTTMTTMTMTKGATTTSKKTTRKCESAPIAVRLKTMGQCRLERAMGAARLPGAAVAGFVAVVPVQKQLTAQAVSSRLPWATLATAKMRRRSLQSSKIPKNSDGWATEDDHR